MKYTFNMDAAILSDHVTVAGKKNRQSTHSDTSSFTTAIIPFSKLLR